MFLCIDFVCVTNCFYDYDYEYDRHLKAINCKECRISFQYLRHEVTGINSTSFWIYSTQLPFVVAMNTAKENNMKSKTFK